MNELINKPTQTPIEIALGIDENGMTTAIKLYTFLEMNPSNYSKWVKRNITENEFAEEGKDFYSYQRTSEGRGNFAEDFKLTASFAKKLSMTAKNERGEQAREYFVKAEEKLKDTVLNIKGLSTEMQALIMHDKKIQIAMEHISKAYKRMDKLEFDIPLYGCEAKELSDHVKRKGVQVLGGKQSNAYQDRSLRAEVYRDIYDQIKREFGLSSETGHKQTYLALKRKYLADAHECIDTYQPPLFLLEKIQDTNSQVKEFV